MELLLNRLKSEFHLARKLFYESARIKSSDNDVEYSNLMDGEIIGESAEKMRIAFRMCFGILDKIAHGICYLFDLPKKPKRDYIYFHTFWEDYPLRFDKLKLIQNPHLIALYSIANDFKSNSGEFEFYKQWRNKLEHDNMILVQAVDANDWLDLFDDKDFVCRVSFDFFQSQCLHLLKICNSAIYSYTYCVRTESMHINSDSVYVPFIVQPR